MGEAATAANEVALRRTLAAIRVSQVLLFIPVLLFGPATGYRPSPTIIALYGVVVVWVGVVIVVVARRGEYSARLALADVAVIAAVAAVAEVLMDPAEALGWANWTVAPMIGAAMMVAAFGTRTQAALATTVISAAYVAGLWADRAESGALVAVVGNVGSLALFAAVTRFVTEMLRASAARTDRLAAEAAQARQLEAATTARLEERTEQYRTLHDTVLSTLSLIARGGLDHRTAEVQERCAAEADFLRGMVNGSPDHVSTSLGTALAKVGHEPAAFGLRVHQQFDNLPVDVPDPIVVTFMSAARESLNNVIKHAGVAEAWLSASADDDGVITMTIADAGVGFDPDASRRGMGIRESLHGRVDGIGGRVTVDSAPGSGTTVEVVWAP